MIDRMPTTGPGRGKWTSTSTSSMPASAHSASAASYDSFSTSGSHTAKPSVDDHAARIPAAAAAASPETTASSYDARASAATSGRCRSARRSRRCTRAASRTERHIGPGHRREAVVERSVVADAAEADLEAEQPAVRRRDADRAAAVAAGADRHHADRRPRPPNHPTNRPACARGSTGCGSCRADTCASSSSNRTRATS